MGYINLTPRYSELVNIYRKMFEQVTKPVNPRSGIRANYQVVRDNFWSHFSRASDVADRYNDLVTSLKDYGWTDESIGDAIMRGRTLNEKERNTIHEDKAA
jgi:hypothetical protein